MDGSDLPDFLILAKAVSLHSICKIKVGATIVRCGKPVSVGFNKEYGGKRVRDKQNTRHAEIGALMTCPKERIRGATIYVYRQHKDGSLAMARPCKNCMKALIYYGVKKVVYSTENGWATERI